MSENWSLAIRIALIFAIALAVYKLMDFLFRKFKGQKHLHIRYIKNILKGLIVIIALSAVASQFPGTKKALSVILASSGLIVAVLGFAAQESLSNIINGLFISIFRPFEIGDRVTMTGQNITGLIEDITLRHTVIKTITNTRLIIPNSVMNKEIIENSHFTDSRSANLLDVWVSYDSDVRLAMDLIVGLIESHSLVIDVRTDESKPQTNIMVRELGNNGICLRATVWTSSVDENFTACSDLRLQIREAFKAHGIEIPYNHLKVVT